PKDNCRDIPRLRGVEQKAGDHRIGLGYAAIELVTKAFAQRLRGAADDLGDVALRDTETGQVAHLLAERIIDDKGCSRHGRLLMDRGRAFRRARRTIDRTLDVSRRAL